MPPYNSSQTMLWHHQLFMYMLAKSAVHRRVCRPAASRAQAWSKGEPWLHHSALSSRESVPDLREKGFIISRVRENFINFAKHFGLQILLHLCGCWKKPIFGSIGSQSSLMDQLWNWNLEMSCWYVTFLPSNNASETIYEQFCGKLLTEGYTGSLVH